MADERQLALRDEVFVETEIAGVSVAIPAVVTNILSDVFWLALPLPDSRLAALAPGQRIDLSFDRPGGAMVLESTFIRRLGGERLGTEKSRVFAVARPAGFDTTERRTDVRVEMDRGVRIRVASVDAPRGYVIGTGRTANIGAGGLQLITDVALSVGDDIVLALALSSRAIVTASGQITRLDETPAAGADDDSAGGDSAGGERLPELRAAVRFTRIAESDRERIACYILAVRRQLPELRGVMTDPADGTVSEPGSADAVASAVALSERPAEESRRETPAEAVEG